MTLSNLRRKLRQHSGESLPDHVFFQSHLRSTTRQHNTRAERQRHSSRVMRMWAGRAILAGALLTAPPAVAEPDPNLRGLWLTTDYPSLTLRAGEETSLALTVYNHGLAPQRTELTIDQKPSD